MFNFIFIINVMPFWNALENLIVDLSFIDSYFYNFLKLNVFDMEIKLGNAIIKKSIFRTFLLCVFNYKLN